MISLEFIKLKVKMSLILGDAEKQEGLSDRSRKSKGIKQISITVPPKNIQKIPAHMRPS